MGQQLTYKLGNLSLYLDNDTCDLIKKGFK